MAEISSFVLGQRQPLEPEAPSMAASNLVSQYVSSIVALKKADTTDRPTVEVNESVGMLAFAYEKLRNSVEYREESVLLRGAIKRILKRRLNPPWNYESTAGALVRELIWARYLKNETVAKATVDDIEKLLAKYSVLRQKAGRSELLQDWILGVAACEIEQLLVDRRASYALAETMFQWLQQKLVLGDIAAEDQQLQLYLAIHRVLLKSDKMLLHYHLFLINVPGWQTMDSVAAEAVAGQLSRLHKVVEEQLNYPLAQPLARAIKKYTPAFLVLDELTLSAPDRALATLTQSLALKKKVEDICNRRYGLLRKRIRTAIVRSMIYIFITKVGLALLLEVPYDKYFFGSIHWWQLGFNVLAPPLFMAALGLSIQTPNNRNTEAITRQLEQLVTGQFEPEYLSLADGLAPSKALSIVFGLISLLTFGLVAWALWHFGFTPLGVGLFIFFFGVVVFFTYRVRQIAREMTVVRQPENFIEGCVTVITLPFLALGYRLSAEFGRLNVLTFVLDVLLEAPFKFLLDMAEGWVRFVRAKREEVIDRHEY